MSDRRIHRLARGVSLIEAIVALAVMAFGLVAIVGLQGALRSNSDLSKQRAEAVRIAQEEIETWRAFTTLQAAAIGVDFADIAGDPDPVVKDGLNASFSVQRTVPPVLAPAPKTVVVSVAWIDRTGQRQSVSLSSAIAGVAPELAGSLLLPQNSGAAGRVNGRHGGIPQAAKKFTDGTSGFVPPQTGGDSRIAWVFNNITGIIARICTVQGVVTTDQLTMDLVAANGGSCDNTRSAQLLSGYVNFAATGVAPTSAEAEAPTGLPLNLQMVLSLTSPNHGEPPYTCYDDAPLTELALSRRVVYYCAIFSNPSRTWSGRLRIEPVAFTGGTAWVIGSSGIDLYKVCRYSTLTNDGTASSKNSAHPLDYTAAGSVPGATLREQNFLVISAQHGCPTDVVTETDPVNANTLLHQNAVAPYT